MGCLSNLNAITWITVCVERLKQNGHVLNVVKVDILKTNISDILQEQKVTDDLIGTEFSECYIANRERNRVTWTVKKRACGNWIIGCFIRARRTR